MNKTLSSTGVDANVIIIIRKINSRYIQDMFLFLLESKVKIQNYSFRKWCVCGVCFGFVYSLIKLCSPSIS